MAQLTRRRFVKASGALAAAAPAYSVLSLRAQAPAPDTGNLRVEKDIVFGKGGTKDLTLDVYRPPAGVASKRMAIVHLFGGGFFVGNKNAGYIINDAKAAIRWTRANADKLGVDANRIVVAGYSAGGMLALMAAGTKGRKEFEGEGGNAGVSSDVNACIGVYPLASAQIATGLFAQGQATPENIAAASPTTYISRNFAPTIFIHGTKDGTVPVQSSIDFWSKLQALNVPAALTLIQGADHAFDNAAPDAVELMAQSIDLFFDRLIVNPKPYPGFGGGGGGRGRGERGRGNATPGGRG